MCSRILPVVSTSGAIGFFHFLSSSFCPPSCVHFAWHPDWSLTGDELAPSGRQYRAAPQAHTLADSLAPASWRHPFTAVLRAVLTAPLRRLPWRRELSVSARSPLINWAEHWEIGIWFVSSVFLCSGPRTPASINMSKVSLCLEKYLLVLQMCMNKKAQLGYSYSVA